MSNLLPKLHYITVATKPHPVLENIQRRVIKNGEHITVLGLQENRNIGWEGTANFGIKLREARDFLFQSHIRPQDVVMLTDAYDIIYCGSQTEVMKRYTEFDKPIIFGCETKCHPDPKEEPNYSKLDTEFPFLNSGMYIGQAWALRYCLSKYDYDDAHDDQRFWTHQYLKYNWLFGLDYENKLFLNTEGMDWTQFTWQNEKATYKTNTPQFVHVNGPDKTKVNYFM